MERKIERHRNHLVFSLRYKDEVTMMKRLPTALLWPTCLWSSKNNRLLDQHPWIANLDFGNVTSMTSLKLSGEEV